MMGHKNVKEVLLNNNSNHIEHLFQIIVIILKWSDITYYKV